MSFLNLSLVSPFRICQLTFSFVKGSNMMFEKEEKKMTHGQSDLEAEPAQWDDAVKINF